MMKAVLASVALLAHSTLAFPQATTTAAAASSSTACNNSPSLCSRSYSNITYLGAHDSPFVSNSSNSFTVSGNQFYNSTAQLSAGVRLLQAQIQHANSSDTSTPLHLCHTDCDLYDGGLLVTWLEEVKTWMDSNPNEVVTILLVNGVDATASTLGGLFTTSGITKYSYTPSSATPSTWPTLQTLISANTRLVTFIADLTSNTGAEYLLNEFDYMWENPYSVNSANNFSCIPDRPSAVAGSLSTAKSSGRMFLMNHFLDEIQLFSIQTPNVTAAGSTNSPDTSITGSLGSAASSCASSYGANPNYLLVDWFNVGPAITTADNLNGISDATGRTTVSTAIQNASNSSGAEKGARRSSAVALILGFTLAVAVGLI